MLPIYIDIDDVLAETALTFTDILKREFGKIVHFDDMTSYDLRDSFTLTQSEFDHFLEIAHRPEELLNIKPIAHTTDVLSKWVTAGYEILIMTGRPTFTYETSIEWLNQHKIPYHTFTMVNKYNWINMDRDLAITLEQLSKMEFCLAVEDNPTMANYLSHKMKTPVALFGRPWNQSIELNPNLTSYNSWQEIGEKIQNP